MLLGAERLGSEEVTIPAAIEDVSALIVVRTTPSLAFFAALMHKHRYQAFFVLRHGIRHGIRR